MYREFTIETCLSTIADLAGKRRFKIYRQLKMYNDPTLNPAIYGSTPER